MIAIIDITKSRFRDADWFSKIEESTIPIVVGGAGGIGSWLTMLLTRVIPKTTPLFLYDFDYVEEVNMAGQLFKRQHIGLSKIQAVTNIVVDFNNYKNIQQMMVEFDEQSLISPIAFAAFDNMKARKVMFESWKKEIKGHEDNAIFIDGRLLAEQFQVFYVTPDRIDKYEKHLFDDTEVEDQNCSYKQTSHFAAAIAAKMVQGFTNWFIQDICELPFKYEEFGSLFLATINDE